MSHFNRPKISNNSLIRDQKSNKHIANRYKKLVHTFKREAVQFFVAKNLAVNHLPLEGMLLKLGTGNGERGTGNGERESGNECTAVTRPRIQNGFTNTDFIARSPFAV